MMVVVVVVVVVLMLMMMTMTMMIVVMTVMATATTTLMMTTPTMMMMMMMMMTMTMVKIENVAHCNTISFSWLLSTSSASASTFILLLVYKSLPGNLVRKECIYFHNVVMEVEDMAQWHGVNRHLRKSLLVPNQAGLKVSGTLTTMMTLIPTITSLSTTIGINPNNSYIKTNKGNNNSI